MTHATLIGPDDARWQDMLGRAAHDFHHLPAEFQGHPLRVERRPVKAGHVHYHHALTWHGSHANTSGRPRRAIALHYITDRTCYDERGEHVMKPFVTVEDGEEIVGEHFPEVWRRG